MVLLTVMLSSFGVGMATQSMTDMTKAKTAASNLFSIIDRVPEIDATSTEGLIPQEAVGKLEFKNVNFAYPSRPNRLVCDNYNLTIESGQTVALVGTSGGGKSTIIALLERFYNPSSGTVKLDGHNLDALNLQWLRSRFSLVGQEPALFSGTIGENIKFGKPNATEDEIKMAAKQANAFDFISQFPDGFDTKVGDRGIQVSGGQKQRIAIARSIISEPDVLLLDEATSALDNESERIVQESLDALMSNRTTIVIAHRLSTIRHADAIAVVQNGRIVEMGKHDELIGIDNGVYRLLVGRQMEKE